jgi:hypothetical protein
MAGMLLRVGSVCGLITILEIDCKETMTDSGGKTCEKRFLTFVQGSYRYGTLDKLVSDRNTLFFTHGSYRNLSCRNSPYEC